MSKTEEQKKPALTAKKRAYADKFLETWSQKEAAASLGLKDPKRQAYRYHHDPAVQEYIKEQLDDLCMQRDEVLARLTEHARAEWGAYLRVADRDLFDRDGKLTVYEGHPYVDVSAMIADGKAHLIKGIKYTRSGDAIIEFPDSQAALVQVGRAMGLFVDRQEVSGVDGEPIRIVLDQ